MKAPSPPWKMERMGLILETIHLVESVLRTSDTPLRPNRIKVLLPRKARRSTIRDAIERCKRLGSVTEGSKGVMWTLNSDPDLWKVVERWQRG